jgi:hypothetical protein
MVPRLLPVTVTVGLAAEPLKATVVAGAGGAGAAVAVPEVPVTARPTRRESAAIRVRRTDRSERLDAEDLAREAVRLGEVDRAAVFW